MTFTLKQVLLLTALLAITGTANADNQTIVVARVGDTDISQQEFTNFYARAQRQEFYHRQPQPGEELAFRQQTLGVLIDRKLLIDEASRIQIPIDEEAIQQQLDKYDEMYAGQARYQKNRETMLANVSQHMRETQLLDGLEARARSVEAPGKEQLQGFYEANPELFTEPEKHHLSLILLALDPSATKATRDTLKLESEQLVEQLRAGEDFAGLAGMHSDDQTAAQGGDMGYMHRGTLSAQAETAIDLLEPGEITDPVKVLEGYAIFRLEGRKAEEKHSLAEVRERAVQLWRRQQSDVAWEALIVRLRANADIEILDAALAGDAEKETILR